MMPLVRRCIGRAMTALAYGAQAVLPRRVNGPTHIGFVTREFFHQDLHGFGGYGSSVRNITDEFAVHPNGFVTDVLLTKEDCRATPVVGCNNPDGLAERFGWYTGEILGMGLDEASLGRFEAALGAMLAQEAQRRQKGQAACDYAREVHSFVRFKRSLAQIAAGMTSDTRHMTQDTRG